MTSKLAALVSSAVLCASPAFAQESYFGGGIAYTSGESDSVAPAATSDLDVGMVTLIFGQRFASEAGFWGWETSADLSFGSETESSSGGGVLCTEGSSGPYLCKHDATLRLVGIYGAPIGQGTEIYGSLGLGVMFGDYGISPLFVESASTYGLTVGVGLNREFGNGLIARGEVIYDDFSRDTQDDLSSDYRGATLRFGLVRKF